MPIPVYVAANPGPKFCNAEKVKAWMDEIRLNGGFSITHDWLAARDAGGKQAAALADLAGIDACVAVILFYDDNGKGMYTEMGYALARNKTVVVVGATYDMIFFNHPNVVRVETLEQALCYLDRDGF